MNSIFTVHILPRQSMSWGDFVRSTPPNSIALDGVVRGGPRYDAATLHINFDHHDGVVREATMSTAMQVYMAIKGGIMQAFVADGLPQAHIYINDTDQDTCLAVWLLLKYKQFEEASSIPHVSRILAINNYRDITGGAYPINLDEVVVRQHNWIFLPYSNLRKSGGLAMATEQILRDNLEAVLHRLDQALMGQAEEVPLDTRHEILWDSPDFKVIDEIGGTEARSWLFSRGLRAYISIVAHRTDGRLVVTVGRRSQFVKFPLPAFYDAFNEAENLTRENGWNGSDLVGGSSRASGTRLSWENLRDLACKTMKI